MSNKSRDYELELFNVMNALGDVEWEMAEDELLDEFRVEGKDVEAEAGHIRRLFSAALKEYRQAPLREAQRKYEQHVAKIVKRNIRLPESAIERRTLLGGFLARKPEIGSSLLTAQHRDFKDLTDADVESYLTQLIELGALENSAETEDRET